MTEKKSKGKIPKDPSKKKDWSNQNGGRVRKLADQVRKKRWAGAEPGERLKHAHKVVIGEETPDLTGNPVLKFLPEKPLDLKVILYWIDLGASLEEIAGAHFIGVPRFEEKLLAMTGHTFSELKATVCGMAKIRLRNNQIKLSEKSAAMAIWLGKQWLGQKENPADVQEFSEKLVSLLDGIKGLDLSSIVSKEEQND